MIDLNTTKKQNNVFYLTPENKSFSDFYLRVRKNENRLLTDEDILKLPHLKRYEWPLRIKSTQRFLDYLSNKKSELTILDIGCGNGWFTNKIATASSKNIIIGLDVNKLELEQATRLFKSKNLSFVYADIFEVDTVFDAQFDIITLNGSIQYFEGFKATIVKLKTFLKPKGEIHIIDSPFYKSEDIHDAKKRTLKYYSKIEVPEMAANYFHHDRKLVQNFEILYQKKNTFWDKVTKRNDSPFSWMRYTQK